MRPPLGPSPTVTLVIPCRNEADHIEACLSSVMRLDWPKDRLEVLVCDGMSSDGTADLVRRLAADHPGIRVLENPGRTLASGWNLGLRHATGSVVCMMIAHQTYEPQYVRASVRYLDEHDADGVGGSMTTLPQEDTLVGRAIAAAWSHPFGVGNAHFRLGTSRPRWVDNIHCGAFRREAIERVHGYDERLTRSQDADMQARLRAAGGRLLLVPDRFSAYYTRSSLVPFARYAVINGYWVARPLEHGAFLAAIRHWVPFLFVASLLLLAALSVLYPPARAGLAVAVGLYVLVALGASIHVGIQRGVGRHLLMLPLVFAILHIGYGIGTTIGLGALAIGRLRHAFGRRRRRGAH